MRSPSRPARPSMRMSRVVAMAPQEGQVAPLPLIVPAPSVRSCSRFCAAFPWPSGTPCSIPKSMRPSSFRSCSASSTRFFSFRQSQRVFRSGICARQLLHLPYQGVGRFGYFRQIDQRHLHFLPTNVNSPSTVRRHSTSSVEAEVKAEMAPIIATKPETSREGFQRTARTNHPSALHARCPFSARCPRRTPFRRGWE